LAECQKQLKSLTDKVDALKQSFGEKMNEAETLRLDLQQTEETLRSAGELLGKLADEEIRWKALVAEIKSESKLFPVNSLLSAAMITYLGEQDEN